MNMKHNACYTLAKFILTHGGPFLSAPTREHLSQVGPYDSAPKTLKFEGEYGSECSIYLDSDLSGAIVYHDGIPFLESGLKFKMNYPAHGAANSSVVGKRLALLKSAHAFMVKLEKKFGLDLHHLLIPNEISVQKSQTWWSKKHEG